MKVFVAGATGAIGRPLLPRLAARGHEVTAMTRSAERGERVRAAGATPAVCDIYDGGAVARAIAKSGAEAVVHQLTALPAKFDVRRDDFYAETNRLRTEGTANLLAGARAAGVRRFVAQSIAFLYEPEGGWVKDERAPVMSGAAGPFAGALDALVEMEREVLGAAGIEGVVLRYGTFYGPGTYYAEDGHFATEARRRRLPVVGNGAGTFSFIHVDDAAAATVAAVEAAEAEGVYNVSDDEPAPMREWVPAYAQALGAPRPIRVPRWLAALVAGRAVALQATTMRGASNARVRRELGWAPERSSWRSGFADLGSGPG